MAKDGAYEKLKLFEKIFVLMPYMHSENITDCQQGFKLLEDIILNIDVESIEVQNILMLYKCWCQQLLDILREFGRYPDRNELLERTNTEKETVYL